MSAQCIAATPSASDIHVQTGPMEREKGRDEPPRTPRIHSRVVPEDSGPVVRSPCFSGAVPTSGTFACNTVRLPARTGEKGALRRDVQLNIHQGEVLESCSGVRCKGNTCHHATASVARRRGACLSPRLPRHRPRLRYLQYAESRRRPISARV